MSEYEDTQATDDDQETEQQTAPESEQQQQTLDDLYKELNIEDEARQFTQQQAPVSQQQTATQQKAPLPYAPDPLSDPDGFRDYTQQHNAALLNQLSAVQQQLSTFQQEQERAQIEKDIQHAIGFLSQKVEGVNPRALEFSLEAKAAEDSRFKKLWDNRGKNPDAWNKALDLFSREVSETFSVKQDPQLTENQRAVAQSQRSMSTTTRQDPNNKWDEMDGDDFDYHWRNMINN